VHAFGSVVFMQENMDIEDQERPGGRWMTAPQ
jgi:hypothetical protein